MFTSYTVYWVFALDFFILTIDPPGLVPIYGLRTFAYSCCREKKMSVTQKMLTSTMRNIFMTSFPKESKGRSFRNTFFRTAKNGEEKKANNINNKTDKNETNKNNYVWLVFDARSVAHASRLTPCYT